MPVPETAWAYPVSSSSHLRFLQCCMPVIIKLHNRRQSASRTLHYQGMRWIVISPRGGKKCAFFSHRIKKTIELFPEWEPPTVQWMCRKIPQYNFFPPAGTNKLLSCSHSYSKGTASASSQPKILYTRKKKSWFFFPVNLIGVALRRCLSLNSILFSQIQFLELTTGTNTQIWS